MFRREVMVLPLILTTHPEPLPVVLRLRVDTIAAASLMIRLPEDAGMVLARAGLTGTGPVV